MIQHSLSNFQTKLSRGIEIKDRVLIVLIFALFFLLNHAGALAAAPLAAMGGLLCLFGHRLPPLKTWPPVIWLALSFLLWAVLSGFWSPYESPRALSGEVRFALGLTLYGLFIYNLGLQSERNKSIARILLYVIFPLSAALYAADFLTSYKLSGLVDPIEGPKNARSNLSHGLSAILLVMPTYLALNWPRHITSKVLIILSYICLVISIHLSLTAAALLAILVIPPAMILAYHYPKACFRLLIMLAICAILFAPLLSFGADSLSHEFKNSASSSLGPRLYIWGYQFEQIANHPLIGNGFDAVRTMTGTYEYNGKTYNSVSLHTHNMGIQIWSELGAIGAILFCASLWALQSTLLASKWLTPLRASVIITTLLVTCIFSSLSYSAWQDWWWGVIGISFAICMLVPGKLVHGKLVHGKLVHGNIKPISAMNAPQLSPNAKRLKLQTRQARNEQAQTGLPGRIQVIPRRLKAR